MTNDIPFVCVKTVLGPRKAAQNTRVYRRTGHHWRNFCESFRVFSDSLPRSEEDVEIGRTWGRPEDADCESFRGYSWRSKEREGASSILVTVM